MPQNDRPRSRRLFLRHVLSASAVLAALRVPAARAQAAAGKATLPHLSPDEPLAKSLGYVEEASQEDRAKFPTYKPGDRCDKCRFFQGTAGDAWGPCQIFVGRSVSSHGWCASYMVKT